MNYMENVHIQYILCENNIYTSNNPCCWTQWQNYVTDYEDDCMVTSEQQKPNESQPLIIYFQI